MILQADNFRRYIDRFNEDDEEHYANDIPNNCAWEFLSDHIPLFSCPDRDLELTYYFRWWVFRKHIKRTPDGWVITEFLPHVPWAGKHNTINMTAALHVAEGRWLRDPRFIEEYIRFWFRGGGTVNGPRSYTCWLAQASLERARVLGNLDLCTELLDDFMANHEAWKNGWELPGGMQAGFRVGMGSDGLFHTTDDRDGGEASIGGHGARPLLNAAMFGDTCALALMAEAAGRAEVADKFRREAAVLKDRIQRLLWNPDLDFFCIRCRNGSLSDVRELHGYAPWFFNLPDAGFEAGWEHLMDPSGFWAPYGPTSAEQRHPGFQLSYEGHECQWNGPSWPMATAITLTAMANLLNDYRQSIIEQRAYFETFLTYARSHRLVRDDGRIVPWIDENLHPYTGDWISRTRLKSWENGTWSDAKGGVERGKDYNHSTFADLVITGLVGLRPRDDDTLVVNPLVPEQAWDWFCLDRVRYRGRDITVVWDREGTRYGMGRGMQLIVNGRVAARSDRLEKLDVELSRKDTE